MIARSWRGAVHTADAERYAEYIRGTGLAAYAATPGNRGAWMLRRDLHGGLTEFVTFSLWDSMDAVRAFAGDDPDAAVFYPEDDDFLVERDLRVRHHEIVHHVDPAG
jgi:heme-degrading monooxygenase HmoA